MISKTVKILSRKKNIDINEMKKSLLLIMNALSSSSDLYGPHIEKILAANLNDKWNTKDQIMAKDFIVAEFTKKTLHPRILKSSPLPSPTLSRLNKVVSGKLFNFVCLKLVQWLVVMNCKREFQLFLLGISSYGLMTMKNSLYILRQC